MASLLFPDNTVLINFALLGRVDLLADLTRGRGAWTATVANECEQSSQVVGLLDLRLMPSVFGEPLALTSAREVVDTASIRARMAAPGESDSAHLGEAEAVALIASRGLRAAFVTDDRQASVIARAEGIPTYSTCTLIKLAVRVGLVTAEEAWTMVTLLRRRTRTLRESPRERHIYMRWLTAKAA